MTYGEKQARKRETNRRERAKKTDYLDYELVQLRLTAAEEEVFESEAESYHMAFDEFAARQLASGRKISISPLNDNETVNLSVTGKSEEDACCYQVLSVFGPDLDLCVALWMFKDSALCQDMSWREAAASRSASRPRYG